MAPSYASGASGGDSESLRSRVVEEQDVVHPPAKPTKATKADAVPTANRGFIAFVRSSLVPLFLMIVSPPGVQFVWVACARYGGDVREALKDAPGGGLWSNFPTPTKDAAVIAMSYLVIQVALLLIIPGRRFVAIPTPMGNRPEYKLNGVSCFVISQLGFAVAHNQGWIDYGAVYDHFGPMLAFLGKAALVGTILLFFKGIYFPTNSDSGRTDAGLIWDLWHGTELHPEIFGVSLKQVINCRFAMMGWGNVIVAFAIKQGQLYGSVSNSMIVSTVLQLVYIFKFFLWEDGYFNSIDIIHDRFGFYIFWGCSAYLPSVYTLTSLFLVEHPMNHPLPLAVANLLVGLFAVWGNYASDWQRQRVRAANGDTTVWGKKPVIVPATYTTGDGKKRSSFLLASGWWGIARHFNYVLELTLAYSWCAPTGFAGILGWFYGFYLTILLVDRAYRDELRCAEKYGAAYDEYCRLVPYKMVPYLY